MKTIFAPLLLALLLAGTATAAPTKEQLARYEEYNIAALELLKASVQASPDRAAILARYEASIDVAMIMLLADTTTEKELNRLKTTLASGRNRHPYTREQLDAALALRAQRKTDRATKKLAK